MKVCAWIKLVWLMVSITLIAACGGGGGSTPASVPVASKTTVSGAITFPASTDMVGAKRAKTATVDNSVTVQIYTLDGVLVPSGTVHPTYDDATRIYSYSIPNLTPNTDYVIKVTRGSQVLKKLVGKAQATAGTVAGQTVDAVSTAAIIIASQKLSTASNTSITLGDPLPSGTSLTTLSATIDASIKPTLLEQAIAAAANSGSTAITASTAGFANVFNLVVSALVENKDPASVLAGHDTLTGGVPIFVVSGGTVTAPSTNPANWQPPSSSQIVTMVGSTATGYTPPTNPAKFYDDLAAQYLAAQDIANASLNYEKALAIDPNDKDANFGGAITSGIMLIQDQDVTTIVAKWGVVLPTANQVVQGASPIKVPFANMTSMPVKSAIALRAANKSAAQNAGQGSNTQRIVSAFKLLQSKLPQQKAGFIPLAKQFAKVPATAPTVSEMQSVIDNVITPRIDTILARLAKVEGQGYTFTVTSAMQGNAQYGTPVALSDPEFYTLDAALNVFQTIFKFAASYNFNIPTGYTYDTISQDPLAMINDPSVFTLKTGGAAKMNSALLNARAAASKAGSAYSAVLNRPAGVGAFDISNWSASDRTDFLNTLDKVKTGLVGPIDLTIGNKTVTIDATKLFTNPLTRNNLPTFRYDVPRNATLSAKYGKPVAAEKSYQMQFYWSSTGPVTQTVTDAVGCDVVAASDLTDYTLNGILPGNTAATNLAGFNAILPVVDGKVISGTNSPYTLGATTDGTSIYFMSMLNQTYTQNQGYTYTLNKIDLSSGAASKYADINVGNLGMYKVVYVNGSFYALISSWDSNNQTTSFDLYRVVTSTSPWTLSSTPAAHLANLNNAFVTDVTASGSDVYYIVNSYDMLTFSNSTSYYKMTGVTTGSPAATLLFKDSSSAYSLAASGNYLYSDSDNFGLVKWDMTGKAVATYGTTGSNWNLLMGNNFYSISGWKLVKYGSLP